MTQNELFDILWDNDLKRGQIISKRNAMIKARECTPEEAYKATAEELNECFRRQQKAIIQYVGEKYNLTPKAMEIIYKRAYEEGHANGSREVVCYTEELAELVADVRNVL